MVSYGSLLILAITTGLFFQRQVFGLGQKILLGVGIVAGLASLSYTIFTKHSGQQRKVESLESRIVDLTQRKSQLEVLCDNRGQYLTCISPVYVLSFAVHNCSQEDAAKNVRIELMEAEPNISRMLDLPAPPFRLKTNHDDEAINPGDTVFCQLMQFARTSNGTTFVGRPSMVQLNQVQGDELDRKAFSFLLKVSSSFPILLERIVVQIDFGKKPCVQISVEDNPRLETSKPPPSAK